MEYQGALEADRVPEAKFRQRILLELLANVARGAALLDEKRPGWWLPESIDCQTLDIEKERRCILGQLYGHFCKGLSHLFPRGRQLYHLSESHGFSTRNWMGQDINAVWRELILERRIAALAEVECIAA